MTPNLSLEPLVSAQAQKHVTVNEALARIDAAMQLTVLDRDLADPPQSPADGDRYLVSADATGLWSGHDGHIAAWDSAAVAWLFLTPRDGWRVWVVDESALLVLVDTVWQSVGGDTTSLNPASGGVIGVNTTADSINRLTVKSDAALFSHDDVTPGSGDMRLTLNKASPANDTSLTLQTGFSARAQVGLTGDDDLRMKVSPDGSTFHDGLSIDNGTGAVRVHNGAYFGSSDTLLSDYETGTWTPQVLGSTTAGTISGGVFRGRYIKIGHLVMIDFQCLYFAISGASGDLMITGLPFAASLDSGRAFPSGNFRILNLNAGSLASLANITTEIRTNEIVFRKSVSGGSWSAIQVENRANIFIEGTMLYRTAS